jgi:4-amino-4-deoxy-L-arabinose transferase-like glycosyltransferase
MIMRRVLYVVLVVCLLVMLLGGLGSFHSSLTLSYYAQASQLPSRSIDWAWLLFDGANFRDEDVAAGVDRIGFSGFVWQPDEGVWRIVHTGGTEVRLNGETVLSITETQPQTQTHTDIPVARGFVKLEAVYFTGLISYAAPERAIAFGIYEQNGLGQWTPLEQYRLHSGSTLPEDFMRLQMALYVASRVAFAGAILAGSFLLATYVPWRNPVVWEIALLVLLAFAVRIIVLYQRSGNDPFFDYLVPGSDNYVLMARESMMGRSHLVGAFFSPGNTLWMMLLTAIFGYGLNGLYLANTVVGALSIGFIYALGYDIEGRRTAILAGLIGALFPPLVFYHTTLQLEALLGALLPVSLWLGIRALRQPRLMTAALFGVSVGLLTLVRMNNAVIGLAYVLALLATADTPLRRKLSLATLAVICTLLVIAPQSISNSSYGTLAVSRNGPDTFYWGINRDGNGADIVGEAWYITRLRHLSYSQAAAEDLRANPVRAIELTLHKWGLLWGNTDIANNVDYQAQGLGASPLLNALSLGGLWGALALLAIGLTGSGLLLTERDLARDVRVFLYSSFVLLTLATLAFTVFGRMRVPLWVLLSVFAAFALIHLLHYRLSRRLIVCGCIALALLAGSQVAKRAMPRKPFFTGDLPATVTAVGVALSDSLRLVGYGDVEARCTGDGYVFLSLFWEVTRQHPRDQTVLLTVSDQEDREIARREVVIGSISYPAVGTSVWDVGTRLEEKVIVVVSAQNSPFNGVDIHQLVISLRENTPETDTPTTPATPGISIPVSC